MGEFKQKAINGVVWNTIQSLSNKSISFLILIFMARLLQPTDYGMVGMLAVFIAIADAFVDCGFGQAIIRKQDRTQIDESTVYYFSIAASILCYLLIFCIAPLVGRFYNMQELSPLLRFLGLKIVISSFSSMHILKYSIDLNFKIPSIIKVSSNILSGTIGLYFAYNGYGAWALAIQQVSMATFSTLLYITISKWKPVWEYSQTSFREMFLFGSKLLGARLLNIFYTNISTIFIGKAYSSRDLGLYAKGQEMAAYPSDILYGIVSTVSYPLLCSIQTDKEKMSISYRQIIKIIGFIIFPMMAIVCVLAQPIICTLFGDQWISSSEYFALLCYPYMLVPICTANFSLLQVVGRSDLVLRLEIITKIMGVIMLLITLPISVSAMCWGTIINVTICVLINTYYTSRFVNVSQWQQLFDLIKPLIVCIIMALLVHFATMKIETNMIKLIVGAIIGLIFYLSFSIIMKSPELKLCVDIVKKKF